MAKCAIAHLLKEEVPPAVEKVTSSYYFLLRVILWSYHTEHADDKTGHTERILL